MGPFEIKWDDHAEALIKNFEKSDTYFEMFMQSLYYKLGKAAIENIKPMTHKSVYYNGNEDLANSLNFNVDKSMDGFEITFYGLYHGNYVDVGNFPATQVIKRNNGKPFPVGLRSGQSQITFTKEIHGMGHTTPEMPTHFSEKTAKWLSENMHDMADGYIQELLDRLVTI